MIKSSVRFITGFSAAIAAYFLYSAFAIPLIDGTIEKSQAQPERTQPASNDRYSQLITSHFAEDDWIRGRCKILDAQQSILFFKEARQLEDGNWEVKPFTMFLNPEGALSRNTANSEDAEKPIILRTEEGAFIKFEDGTSPNSPGGKFTGARMPGKVEVIREESSPGAGDRIEFITRNIQMDNKQILAVNPVQFRYGKHHGKGHNLTIQLNPMSKKKNERLPLVRNLKTVELAHLDQLWLEVGPDDVDQPSGNLRQNQAKRSTNVALAGKPSPTAKKPKNQLISSATQAPVKVTCTGPFRLDFGKSQMVLFDQVHVEQMHAKEMHDHLYCDRLELDFAIRKEATTESGKIQFRDLRAIGQPARLLVDSRNAYAQAEVIHYKIRKRIVHCKKQVIVRDGTYQFSAPEMQYQLTLNNQLGTGWATGPGEVIGNPDDPNNNFRASWNSEFNIQPHEGKKAISLHGNANIVFRGEQNFACDELHFWIWEKRRRGNRPVWDFFPAQLLGRAGVTMDAPDFAGNVDEIRVFWPLPIRSLPRGPANRSPQSKSTRNQHPKSQPTHLVSHPTEPPQPSTKSIVESKLSVQGKIAIARLNRENLLKSFRVEQQVIAKSIDLTPLHEGQSARQSLEIVGDLLQVDATKVKDSYKFEVSGNPAHIDSDGIRFSSKSLAIDQSNNLAWTDEPGEVLISPEVQAEQRLFGPQPSTKITWNKRLEFDGSVIRLTDRVRFSGLNYLQSGEQVEFEGKTFQLAAQTNQRVNFRRSETGKSPGKQQSPIQTPIQIVELALLNDAYIRTVTRESINVIKSIDEIQATEINVRIDSGDSRAIGPGNIRSIREGDPQPTPGAQVAAKMGNDDSVLSYLQIAFAGQIIGNIKQRNATVNDQVRCVYGPAENWETRYDPDATAISGDEIYLNCSQLKLNQWQPVGRKKPVVEIAAVGNTEIEGKKFRAIASQLTYTEQNENILLEGLRRENAKIWFRKNDKQPWQYGEAKRFRYQRSTSEIIGSEEVKEMRFLQFEAPQRRRK